MVDESLGVIPRMVIPLLQLLVLRTAFLRPLFVPLVNQREVQVLVFGAGALGDDADAVEIGSVGFGAVEL